MKIDVFGSYLQTQAAFPEKAREPQLAITISREVGAGGRTIAELVAQRLAATEKTPTSAPWAVFDANLAKQVLEDHELPPDLERFVTEDARLPVEAIVEEVLGLHPSGWTLAQHTTKTILRLAGLGHVVVAALDAYSAYHGILPAERSRSSQVCQGERPSTTTLCQALF
jgi:hypothetical protein